MAGLFNGKQKVSVKERWRYTADSTIWRIIVSDEGYFVCEDRSKERKAVSFFCIDHNTGKVLWKNLTMTEPWWTGIEAVYKNYVFFHEFTTPDMPDHKKIHVYDVLTGKELWRNDEAKFLFAANNSVFTVRDLFEKRIFSELDIATGTFKGEVQPQYLDTLRVALPDPVLQAQFPNIIDHTRPANESIRQALEKATGKAKNVIMVELLEYNGLFLIGFYDNHSMDPEHPDVNQHLVIIDAERMAVLYSEIITLGVNAPIPDTFFCSGNTIFLVKDKNSLISLEIQL